LAQTQKCARAILIVNIFDYGIEFVTGIIKTLLAEKKSGVIASASV